MAYIHPPIIVSAAFLFGPLCGGVAAVAALASGWLDAPAHWGAMISLSAACWLMGCLAWQLGRATRLTAISLVVALTVLVPPALLPWTETASALAFPHGLGPCLASCRP